MYPVQRNGKTILEADACGIGFLATRKGVPERRLVDLALELTQDFDHRGAPGHGAGLQLDIPWPLLLDRFPRHAKAIAGRDVALGMFFLPYEGELRGRCVEAVERIAAFGGSRVLAWADVPLEESALPPGSSARRTVPRVRQALFARPEGLGEEGWFACRYLLRLALDAEVGRLSGDAFAIASLSNRTVVYKGLCELSKIADLYPDLKSPDLASRYVLFHSRYCTNTTTAWRRAQPFWSLAHNGEINTIAGNVAWVQAIGKDLLRALGERHPSLAPLAARAEGVVCSGGSDTANLEDMTIALLAGGVAFPQAVLGLLPPAGDSGSGGVLAPFLRAASVYLGACDGPAAIVGCDGETAVAHLDRNGLRPLWTVVAKEYVLASSELTGTLDLAGIESQSVMRPGEALAIHLPSGRVLGDAALREEVARLPFPSPESRLVAPGEAEPAPVEDLPRLQRAFGMTSEDLSVLVGPMAATGKPPLGAMGDDTPVSALLDDLPRRPEDYFALRFAQETSPPIDPVRDAWVFDRRAHLGDRNGLWSRGHGALVEYPGRVLSRGQAAWLAAQPFVRTLDLTRDAEGAAGIAPALDRAVAEALALARVPGVLLLSDRAASEGRAPLPALRALSRIHSALAAAGVRAGVGLAVESGCWDVHHVAALLTLGADVVSPWLGCASAAASAGESGEAAYLKALEDGVIEAMSMAGVTPSSAYVGARLVEAIGLDRELLDAEFPGVPGHLGGVGGADLDREWHGFHAAAYAAPDAAPYAAEDGGGGGGGRGLLDAGEYRHTKAGRPHANDAELVRSLQGASGYARKIHAAPPGTRAAYDAYRDLVAARRPITVLDLVEVRGGGAIPLEEVEPVEAILWRFMASGMSEGALSEPAHRAVARGMNLVRRLCRLKLGHEPAGIGPVANSGEGGFDKARVGTRDGNASIQYAGGRFTITPMTAATAREAEIKFAQGAKPGKGGQLPGRKVSPDVALRRGCDPGTELVSPPVNHNLYSIEDVKLMLESWRHLNPEVGCSLKFVATHGIEMVAVGGVNAGANRIHLSDGCGGTGAAKRADQKHAGVPLAAVLGHVHDMLVEEGARPFVELSADGGVQTGEHALKLFLLGADRVAFGTSLLVAIGCSMLRKCHLSGPDPADPTGRRRLGCTPGIATQDPELVARFTGNARQIARTLVFLAEDVRERLAAAGARSVGEIVGRRDLLDRKPALAGKAARLDLSAVLGVPGAHEPRRDYARASAAHMPARDEAEVAAAHRALAGEDARIEARLTNVHRCTGVAAAGIVARARGDLGLDRGSLAFVHRGAAGHYYGAYCVEGLSFRLVGVAADSAFTAAYGGELAIVPAPGFPPGAALVGSAFGYGARGGRAYIAGVAGNRFGVCFRRSHERGGPLAVVEGIGANAFQYMTGGTALVLGSTGPNLGAGLTGGVVYLLDAAPETLDARYVAPAPLSEGDAARVEGLLRDHAARTGSPLAAALLTPFDPARFAAVRTRVAPDLLPEWEGRLAEMR